MGGLLITRLLGNTHSQLSRPTKSRYLISWSTDDGGYKSMGVRVNTWFGGVGTIHVPSRMTHDHHQLIIAMMIVTMLVIMMIIIVIMIMMVIMVIMMMIA